MTTVLERTPFTFQLRSLDSDRKITFVDPLMGNHSERYSSGEDAFSRPFAQQQHAQSIEAPSVSYSFPDLYLDARFRHGATEESGGQRPDLRGIIQKIKAMMEVHPVRMRKDRLSVSYGATVLGLPNTSYLYLNSLSVEGEHYGNSGHLLAVRMSFEFKEYGWQ